MNPINPYRRNCEVMRSFFSKPIFLLLGIAFSLSILSEIITGALNSTQGSISIQISVLNVLPIIAFFMFYFKSRSRAPFVSFNAPITLMKVYSIINIVVAALGVVLIPILVLCLAVLQSGSEFGLPLDLYPFFDIINSMLLIIALPETIVSLLFSIAMLTLFNSFKKSVSTIYLQRKGSVFFAVTAILSIIYIICVMVVSPFMLEGLLDSLKGVADLNSAYYTINIPDDMSKNVISSVISYGVQIVITLLFAVLGLMYNSYIKKLSTSICVENKQTHFSTAPVTPDVPNNEFAPMNVWNNAPANIPQEQPPANLWNDTVPVNEWNHTPASTVQTPPPVKPVEFDPKPVFGNDNPYTSNNAPAIDVASPEKPASKFCSNCGKENSSDCMFCGGCGNKL